MFSVNEGLDENIEIVDGVAKSAILKGNTLVNLCVDPSIKTIGYSSLTSSKYDYRETLKPNTTYTILFKISDFDESASSIIEVSLNSGYETYQTISNNGRHSITFTTQSDTTNYTSLWFYFLGASTITGKSSDIIVLEGDYANLDVPFFTGIQSVKMPVLTTSNEDGTKTNILSCNEEVTLRGIGDVQDELNLLTGELTQRVGEVVLDGNAGWGEYNGNYYVTVFDVQAGKKFSLGKVTILSNLYPSFIGEETDEYIASGWDGNQIKIRDVNLSLEELKSKLMGQPLVATYISNEESVKTVDLSVVDQDNNTTDLYFFKDGHIIQSSGADTSLIPTLDYQAKTSNSYVMDLMKSNTQYTMKATSASGTFTIDGTSYDAGTNGTFTSPSSMTNNLLIMSDNTNEEVMIIEGDVTDKTIPYFEGIKSAFEGESKIEVLSTNNLENTDENHQSNTMIIPFSQPLRSINEEIRDEIDIDLLNKKAVITQRIELDNVTNNYIQLENPIIEEVDIVVTDQNGNEIPKPKSYDEVTHFSVNSLIPPIIEVEVQTSNQEDLETLSDTTDEIENQQNQLMTTSEEQEDGIQSVMLGLTEIFEESEEV